jgi:hypothetical protein
VAKVKIKFQADGDGFKVDNMCANTGAGNCVGEFKSLLGGIAQFSSEDVEYTDEYYQKEEMPPQLEEIDS